MKTESLKTQQYNFVLLAIQIKQNQSLPLPSRATGNMAAPCLIWCLDTGVFRWEHCRARQSMSMLNNTNLVNM